MYAFINASNKGTEYCVLGTPPLGSLPQSSQNYSLPIWVFQHPIVISSIQCWETKYKQIYLPHYTTNGKTLI